MSGREPGERVDPRVDPAPDQGDGEGRLVRPPSDRYSVRAHYPSARQPTTRLAPPLATAVMIAVLGSATLILVGGGLASTAGLLFVSGAMGAAIGLVLARAAVPGASGPAPLTRRGVEWLAIGLAIAAVLVADVGTWLYAQTEGGTLGLLDYLWTAFGPFVPGELILAATAAAWGASAGPVQR